MPQASEYRVPIKLPVSESHLYIKLVIFNDFPRVNPVIQVMSKVSHRNIEDLTYNYIGPAI